MTTDERTRGRTPGRAGALAIGLAAVVGLGLGSVVPACGDGDDAAGGTGSAGRNGDGTVDLITRLDARPDLAGDTEAVLGELADDPDAATVAGRAEALAGRIAESIRLADELLPDGAAYEEAAGGPAGPRFAAIGGALGATEVALAEIDGDGGDPVESLAYALRLGNDLAGLLGPSGGADADIDADVGLGWVLTDPGTLDAADRDEVAGLLAEGRDVEAAERLRDLVDGLDAATVVDATAAELAEHIPVTNEDDLLTHFLTAYEAATTDGG